jgi:hypothetical protein
VLSGDDTPHLYRIPKEILNWNYFFFTFSIYGIILSTLGFQYLESFFLLWDLHEALDPLFNR